MWKETLPTFRNSIMPLDLKHDISFRFPTANETFSDQCEWEKRFAYYFFTSHTSQTSSPVPPRTVWLGEPEGDFSGALD